MLVKFTDIMTSINFDEPSTGNVSSDNATALIIKATGKKCACISCESTNDQGQTIIAKSGSTAIFAECSADDGIVGKNTSTGQWAMGRGVYGEGPQGVKGKSTKPGLAGVAGEGTIGIGGFAPSEAGWAVYGNSPGKEGIGVMGSCNNLEGHAIGVVGRSKNWIGVMGTGKITGRFVGDVEVTGDIKLLNPQNADCAEDFDISEDNIEPGTVVVLTENGSLRSSHQEYDKKVAGIISGAGGYKPAIVLNRHNQSQNQNQNERKEDKNKHRLPIALMGKVHCKVDATHSPIEIGDLLTTSSTKGYAMKADDVTKAFGAVLGKALGCINEGLGMIPVLVTLQ
jgi:hypothetical protein